MITTSFGTLTSYKTGNAIRPATPVEWRASAEALTSTRPGHETGAYEDQSDYLGVVYVDGGPDMTVSDDDIKALRDEAGSADDAEQVRLCNIAISGDGDEHTSADDARLACVHVILDNRAYGA
jgi:hypothetical protein